MVRGSGKPTEHPGPELVFAIVKPVGTPDTAFQRALQGALLDYSYRTEWIKLSEILADLAESSEQPIVEAPMDERIQELITFGDDLCRLRSQASAVAVLGVTEIANRRVAANQNVPKGDRPHRPLRRTAFVIDSIKRVAEVTKLRAIYGDRLLVIGLNASQDARIATLRDAIKPHRTAKKDKELTELAEALVERDLREPEEFGQDTLRTYPLADVFVDTTHDVDGQVTRVLDLLFGNPEYPVPTVAEFGMQLATTSRTRSSELGLKVGAAILQEDFSVVSLGVNRHPTSDKTPPFDSSALDIRAVLQETLGRLDTLLNDEAMARLQEDPERMASELLAGDLSDSSLRSLTEFQPTVHAEMDALLNALQQGKRVEGATLFVSAYPCHSCAKHLISLGVKVRYLERYPKSRAVAMYGREVSESFASFIGVAPRRYAQLFSVNDDRKASDGSRQAWSTAQKAAAEPRVHSFDSEDAIATRESAAISAFAQQSANVTQGLVGPEGQNVATKPNG